MDKEDWGAIVVCIMANIMIDNTFMLKMIGGTPEVRSDKSLFVLTFGI